MASKRTQGARELRRVIEERGITQADVRKACGVPAGMVPRWVSGARGPDMKNALILRELYSIPLESWLDDKGRKQLERVRISKVISASADGC